MIKIKYHILDMNNKPTYKFVRGMSPYYQTAFDNKTDALKTAMEIMENGHGGRDRLYISEDELALNSDGSLHHVIQSTVVHFCQRYNFEKISSYKRVVRNRPYKSV